MKTLFRSKAFWVCAFFLVVALVSKCVFDTSGLHWSFSIASGNPNNGCLNVAYSFEFKAEGGTQPYTWTYSGNIPPGLKLDSSSGLLSGTPTQNGDYSFRVMVTDKNGATWKEDYVVSIKDFNITDGAKTLIYCPGLSFDYAVGTCGGTTPFTWSLKSGSLPSGITLTTGGHLAGKSSATGKYPITVLVTDKAGLQAEHDYTLTSASYVTIVSTSPLPKGQTSKPYSAYQLEACGGTSPYTWDEPDGDITPGLKLSSAGLITGTPTKSGDFTFRVVATDNAGKQAEKNFSMTIDLSVLGFATASPLPDGKECAFYSTPIKGTGGTGTYSWTIPATSQPPDGLTLSKPLGVLSGTPTVPRSFSFAVELSDGTTKISKTFSLTILENPAVTSELIVPEVRHTAVSAANTISLSSTTKVKVDFRFTTASYLNTVGTPATLQVIGECTTISTTDLSVAQDLNADGLKEIAARFDASQVVALLAAAGKTTAGDKATLRLSVTVAETGKTYVQTAGVTLVK